jgi:hypothetical protein
MASSIQVEPVLFDPNLSKARPSLFTVKGKSMVLLMPLLLKALRNQNHGLQQPIAMPIDLKGGCSYRTKSIGLMGDSHEG